MIQRTMGVVGVRMPGVGGVRMLLVVLGVVAADGFAATAGFVAADEATRKPLIFAADRPIDMKHIKLELAVDLKTKRVDGVATLTMTPLRTVSHVTLDAVDFETHGVRLALGETDSVAASYTNDGEHIEIDFGRPVEPGEEIALRIEYSLHDPDDGLHFFAPDKDDPEAPYQVWSQGQSIKNRYWIPSFDHPNEMQTTEMIVTADASLEVLSNGRMLSSELVAGDTSKRVTHWLQDTPHVIYLVTLVVGDFAVTAENWRGKPVLYYVPPDRADEVQFTFGNTMRMLDFFSDKIGVEYPWDKYAQVSCYNFGGGMENTSATTLGENSLHTLRSTLDGSSDGLLAHELAHQWFGDYLTCREWAHLWLNEGFASYFEALWNEHDKGADEFAYNMYGKARSAISGGKKYPIVHRRYDNPGQQFDSRAYPKGAWVLHMLRRRLGDDLFWRVINKHVTQNAYKTVETVDLRKAVESVSGRSFERFFHDWTERPGHPVLDVAYKWNAEEQTAEVTIKQTQKSGAFHFPLTLEFRTGGDRDPIRITRQVTEKETTILADLPGKPSMFLVDPGNTVLKEITEKKGRDLWVAQLTADADPVGRIMAAKQLGKKKNKQNRKVLAKALADDKFHGVKSEIATVLSKMGGDIARDALIAGLKFKDHKARRACAAALGKFKDDETAAAALGELVRKGDASFRVEAAAIRAFGEMEADEALAALKRTLNRDSRNEEIRSAALGAISKLDDPSGIDLLMEWSAAGKPKQCRRAAVGGLARLAMRIEADDQTMQRVKDRLSECLTGGDRRLRGSAVRAIGELGERADSMLASLREIERDEDSGRFKRALKSAIEKIEQGKPAQKQVAEVRKELDELRDENKQLRKRITNLEAKGKAFQEAGASGAAEAGSGR